MMSNMQLVDRAYVEEFVAAYEYLFEADPREYETFKDFSAQMRRVFSRKKRPIQLIGRDGGYFKVMPYGRGMKEVKASDLKARPPFTSARSYERAIREAGGTLPAPALAAE
jgi:hypothetical protein